LQRDFRAGRSGIGVMITRVDRATGDSVVGALLPSVARQPAVVTQHQTRDGRYRMGAWSAISAVQGSAAAIARLQLSPVHAYQRPDDGAGFDPRRTSLGGTAGSISGGKVGGGIARFDASYRWISPGFDVNEMGFLTVSGMQAASLSAGVRVTRPGRLGGIDYGSASATVGTSGEWSSSGLPFRRSLSFTGTLQLANLAQLQAKAEQQLPGALCAVSCTRGGPAILDPPRSTLTVDFTGDGRRPVVPHLNLQLDRDDGGRTRGGAAQLDAVWRIRSNLGASLAVFASTYRHASQFYRRFGDPVSDTAHYTIARLDQATRSLTARVDYTITTTLSVQWYAQAFVSRGAYDDVREIADARADRWDDRFRPYADSSVITSPGGIDFKQLRSNAVLRWEYRRGSTLFLVWSQGRDFEGGAPAMPGVWPGRDCRDLFSLRPQNTIAVKAAFWLSR
jgi:hypothetical protein